ncbi:hypothetical protein SLEP1_g59712, partial [Rubroshorea leprosula]
MVSQTPQTFYRLIFPARQAVLQQICKPEGDQTHSDRADANTICLSALLHGLKRGWFLDDLLENPPKTWNEEQPSRREENKKQKVNEQWGKPADFPKYANYIPLILPRSQILAQIQHWVRRPPPPLHDSPMADKSKHYDYHRAYGHNTEDCQHLKDELEFLACNGKLEGYVQRYQLGSTQDVYQDSQYLSEQGRACGIHSGGQSARGRKAYARQVMTINKNKPLKRPFEEAQWESALITFSLTDYKRADGEPDVMMPHAGPFVATVHIGNHNVNKGVGVLKGNQKMARACYQDTFKKVELAAAPAGSENHRPTQLGQQTMSISDIKHRPEGVEQKAEPVEPVETVPSNPDVLERTVKIGTKLIEEERAELLEFLRVNQDVFAWTTNEMPGIPAELTVHKLSTDPTKRSVVQKHRLFGPEKEGSGRSADRASQDCKGCVAFDRSCSRIAQKPELSGQLIGWSVELSEYDLKFQPRTTIKGQAVVDFLVECISATVEEKAFEHPVWVLYVDGATNIEGSGARAVLVGPDGFKSEHALRFKFQTTNNAVEYEALIYGLKLASELKVQSIQVFSDSQLVVGRVNGSCEIRDPQLGRYASVVNRLKSGFIYFQIDKIPRADNHRADELSKLASSQHLNPHRSTIVELFDAPSYTDVTVECQLLSTDPSSPSWTTPLINYLQSSELPEDPSAAKLIKRRAAHFTLLDNQLYKRAVSMPLLHCLTPYEAEYVVREIHEGVCGTHIDGKTLAQKLLRHDYYWPIMVEDAQKYVKNLSIFVEAGEMFSSLPSPWPFAQWGVDLLGPFVKGKGGYTYLVVTVDYFTKWIEAKPLSMTTEKKIEEFLFNSMLCKFGILKRIIANNGPQFRAAALRSFCNDYGIELSLTSVYTPQSNGQAESANKIVLRGLKTRVLAAHSNWVDELSKLLWSCRTTPSLATGETPFSLAYGAEAVIPVEVGLPYERA